MRMLSLSQKYLLCALGEKGKFSSLDLEKGACLVAAGILELLIEDIAVLEGKKISVTDPLPPEEEHLRILYQQIQKKQPVSLEALAGHFSFALSDKGLLALIGDIGDTLEQKGCARKETGGLLVKYSLYFPDPKAKDAVVQNIRTELLEEGEPSEDIVALTVLLHQCGELKRYFSDYEKKHLKARLKTLKNSSENLLVLRMVGYIEALFAAMVISAT